MEDLYKDIFKIKDAIFRGELDSHPYIDFCIRCVEDLLAERDLNLEHIETLVSMLYERDSILASIKLSHPHLVPDDIAKVVTNYDSM